MQGHEQVQSVIHRIVHGIVSPAWEEYKSNAACIDIQDENIC